MSTDKHSPLGFGASLDAAILNAPLGQLDAAIVAVENALGQTALPVTTIDATANSGQPVVPVTTTTGFVVGQSVFIGDIAGTFETRIILSIQAGISLTMTANLTNTYAVGKLVSGSPSEIVAARGASATLDERIDAIDALLAAQIALTTSPIGADVRHGALQSIANATSVACLFDTETSDPHGFHDPAVNTERLTVPAGLGGMYVAYGQVTFAANATGIRYVTLRKNGVGGGIAQIQVPAVNGDRTQITIAYPVVMAVGDYVELVAQQSSGGALNISFASGGQELRNKLALYRL